MGVKELISLQNSHSEEMHSESDMDSDDGQDVNLGRKSLLKRSDQMTIEKPETELAGKYKQRVLLLSSRGITHRFRHFMNDLHVLMPHSKKESKIDSKSRLEDINEIAELTNCSTCLYLETRKHSDLFMWISKTPNGPSAKFIVRNVHTMDELKMTGNCLKGSRPILSFDSQFDSKPHWALLKEMFVQTFAVPRTSRKIKPFVDHVMSFSIADNKVWLRNYQIVEAPVEVDDSDGTMPIDKTNNMSLVEIGPRCVLDLIRIFDGSFAGTTLYENQFYVSPNDVRRAVKEKMQKRHFSRLANRAEHERKMLDSKMPVDPLNDVFE